MENLRLYIINSMAVGFSLANINMMLSTLVLIASLIWTILQIVQYFSQTQDLHLIHLFQEMHTVITMLMAVHTFVWHLR